MIVYVGAGSSKFRDFIIDLGHGQMLSRQRKTIPKYGRWAWDNGAFGDWKQGKPFDTNQYLSRLYDIAQLPDDRLPDWCVVPDIVADRTSLSFSLRWRQTLARVADPRLKWYLVIQDFMTVQDVHDALCMENFDGLFVGGSPVWKKETAEKWVNWGHNVMGLPVHVGGVNGPGRLQWAVDIGADSIDGTGWVIVGWKWAPWLKDIPKPQLRLFPFTPKMPEEWVRFGVYLESIWGETDWGRWAKASCPRPEEVEGMSPKEFIAWLRETYLAEMPGEGEEAVRAQFAELYLQEALERPPQAGESLEFWKRFVFWELERILKEPFPPEAPPPALQPPGA